MAAITPLTTTHLLPPQLKECGELSYLRTSGSEKVAFEFYVGIQKDPDPEIASRSKIAQRQQNDESGKVASLVADCFNHTPLTLKMKCVRYAPQIIGSGIGAAGGAAAGFCTPIPIVTVPLGAAAGGIGGWMIGDMIDKKWKIGSKWEYQHIVAFEEASLNFLRWHAGTANAKAQKLFEDFIAKDPVLADIRCAITLDLPALPIITKCKHLFDFFALSEWLLEKDTCPKCRRLVEKDFIKLAVPQMLVSLNRVHELSSHFQSQQQTLTEEAKSLLDRFQSIKNDMYASFRKLLRMELNMWRQAGEQSQIPVTELLDFALEVGEANAALKQFNV